ncbi:MAG: hypothetical protein RL318_1698, partial [Fibrobacterota bacterium]
AFATPRILPSGLHYGGITIDAAGDHAALDSANIAGLPPGDYILRAISNIDTTQTVDIPFTVPFLARPKFLATPSRIDVVGSSFPIEIGAFKPSGTDSTSIRFVLSSTPGIRFFRDSLLTSPIGASDTLMTGSNGIARRIWVRGERAGTFALVVGAIPGDTAHIYPGVTFNSRGLRFLDTVQSPISAPWPLRQDPYDTLDFRIEAWTLAARCTPCNDSLRFDLTTPGLVVLDSMGRIQSGVRLNNGYAKVRLVASRTVRNASLVATGDKGDTLTWSPITFSPPRLAFVDSLGREIDSLPRSGLVGIPEGPVFLAALGAHGLCTSCTGNLAITANVPGISILQGTLVPQDSIALLVGKAQFRLNSPRQILDLRLVATSPAFDPDTLMGITFRVEPPSGGYVLDADGDGRADSVVLELRSPLDATDSLRFTWPNRIGQTRTMSASSSQPLSENRAGFRLSPWAEGETGCRDLECADLGSWKSSDAHGNPIDAFFPLRDSVPPVARRALLRFSSDGLSPDTLDVWFSEPLTATSPAQWIAWGRASLAPEGTTVQASHQSLLDDGTHAILLLTADSTIAKRRGDSVRIAATGSLRDPSGIASPARTAWVPLEFGPRPSAFAMGTYPPVRRVPRNSVPSAGESALQMFVRSPSTGAWLTLDGRTVEDTARLGGVWIETNQPLRGKLFLYDNLGVHVASQDLKPLEDAFSRGDLERSNLLDSRGRGRFWLAWNGTSQTGALVGSGIYTLRLVTHQEDEAHWNNRLTRLGWQRLDKP